MRKFIIPMLLASVAATPAIAGPRDRSDRAQARSEQKQDRQQAREDRQQPRAEHQQMQAERQQAPRDERQQVQAQRQQAPREVRQQNFTDNRQQPNRPQYAAPQRVDRQVRIDQRDARINDRRQDVQQRNDNRAQWQRDKFRARPPVVSNTPRPGTQPPPRVDNHHGGDHHWNGDWRNNSRYDWRNYRNHHRSLFHLDFYYDPFGWSYSPFQIGWRMWPNFYSSRYWINDPSYYSLPYAPPGMQWVRYYNDAVLVDTWSGQVEDVLYNFFW